jgi:hypothetical protein
VSGGAARPRSDLSRRFAGGRGRTSDSPGCVFSQTSGSLRIAECRRGTSDSLFFGDDVEVDGAVVFEEIGGDEFEGSVEGVGEANPPDFVNELR